MPTIYVPKRFPDEPKPGTACERVLKTLRAGVEARQRVSGIHLAKTVSHRFGEYIRQLRELGWQIELHWWSYRDSEDRYHRVADYELIAPPGVSIRLDNVIHARTLLKSEKKLFTTEEGLRSKAGSPLGIFTASTERDKA